MIILNITTSAATKIQEQLKKRGSGYGIRTGVRPSGCNGYSYILEFVDQLPEQSEYSVFYANNDANSRVFVLDKDYPFLNGATLDYVKNGLNEGFEFRNPNSRDTCGCGESFRV